MKRNLLAVCVVLFLATACMPGDSPEYITYYLNKGFATHPVNEFFYYYGYPAEEYETTSGKIYRWSSVESWKGRHSSAVANNATEPYKNHYHPSDNYQSVTAPDRQYCELRIYTDKQDIIQEFRISVDTIGIRSPSRCTELFNKVYP